MDLCEVGDPHVAAHLMKSFLNELKEPLLTFDLYDDVLDCCSTCFSAELAGHRTRTARFKDKVSTNQLYYAPSISVSFPSSTSFYSSSDFSTRNNGSRVKLSMGMHGTFPVSLARSGCQQQRHVCSVPAWIRFRAARRYDRATPPVALLLDRPYRCSALLLLAQTPRYRLNAIRRLLVGNLPCENYEILFFIFKFLTEVSRQCSWTVIIDRPCGKLTVY